MSTSTTPSTSKAEVVEKQAAILQLIRKVLGVEQHADRGPQTYYQLSDAYAMYAILSQVSPVIFRDAQEMSEMSEQGASVNWVVRKGNLLTLLRHMNEYAVTLMGAPSALSLMSTINAGAIANSALLMGSGGEGAAATGSSGGDADHGADEGEENLMALTDLFVAMAVLSGLPDIMQHVKSLPRATQVLLSNIARAAMTKYELKPMKRYETPSSMVSEGRPPSTRRTVMSTRRHKSALRGVEGAGGDATGAAASAAPPLVAGQQGDGADDTYYRNATVQLRRELEEVRGRCNELESRYQMSEDERKSIENKYRLLLAEQGARPAAVDVESLTQQNALKDESIQALTKKVEEQNARLAAFKEATVAHEQALQLFKQKSKYAEETLITKSNERRDALEKLSLAEDRLAVQMKARSDLENEVEELKSQVTLLKLTQKNPAEEEEQLKNSSFASNGSLDRVMQLENEIDATRQQRDAFQKQLHVLQRQVSSMPMAAGTAATDTLKAQLRQVEKEKDALQQQLTVAHRRLEELQPIIRDANSNSRAPSLNASVTEVATAAATSADGASSNAAAIADMKEAARRTRDADRREKALLSSMLLQYGYRNLTLQQHEVLLRENAREADTARSQRHSSSMGTGDDVVRDGAGLFTGSFLTRQRHDIEQGLYDSLIHGTRAALR